MTLAELEYGASKSSNPPRNREALKQFVVKEFKRVPSLRVENWV